MEDSMSSIQEKRRSEGHSDGILPEEGTSYPDNEVVVVDDDGTVVNASGWQDQLDRQYGLLSLCGIALTVDNAWVALGSSISVSIANGGPPGLIFSLIVAGAYYSVIGLNLAEFASAIPSAGGVYHWATVTGGPRWGRILGFYAGWINFFGWMFDLASLVQITANITIQMYTTYHPDYVGQPWHIYVTYLLILWISAFVVIFANRLLPYSQYAGMFFVIVGGAVTIIVLAAMPKTHASSHFVWGSFDENNLTGWTGGVAFLCGVLNGAFTIGTPDAITHMAEELPHPKRDLPKAIGLQIGLGFLYAFCFAIALCYSITDLNALLSGVNGYPLATIYSQATNNNRGATFGLLFIIFWSSFLCTIGTVLTNSRIYWSLARDNAVPLSSLFGKVNESLSCPVYATLLCVIFATGLGAIPLGSSTAFIDLTGSFIILTTVSYAIPIVTNMLTGQKYLPKGPFKLGKTTSTIVGWAAVILISFFNVFYCFPFSIPTTTASMNYNSVILVGVIALTSIWWMAHGVKHYPGPRLTHLYIHEGTEQISHVPDIPVQSQSEKTVPGSD
ncbi:amino acid transporter, putative [Talaromyces stipitatus ATCC 10500]|uniref:Amino acid transporter, putative n=1 Tax=Talaromyces stipitatus (strain ATCC 10500 / CBS 375.48 / QM 6759 / NRRL 1006) TaxID=441959 RepID=B8M7H2_TALSN|nr:amino acid transporter, putative [Talaromyces stipitatus ATCC 10500]EED19525.1 amino acid transporter, putative [Talaromyces stipitatus ATCC 10500]